MKNLYFRVDVSNIIGIGHIKRCLKLASYVNNYNIYFICKNFQNNTFNEIKEKYNLLILDLDKDISNINDVTTWLGESYINDANKTIKIINKDVIDIMIIDHYAIDYKWEDMIKENIKINKLIVIEDYIERVHHCNILINNLVSDKALYKKNVPSDCNLLLGLNNTIVNKNIFNLKKNKNDSIKRINIFVSGSDYTNETENIVIACNLFNIENDYKYDFDVVIGGSNENKDKIINLCKKFKNFSCYYNLPQIDELLSKSDIAIGALGQTSFERIVLKIPSISFIIAENQNCLYELFRPFNIFIYLGKIPIDYKLTLKNALYNLIDNYNLYIENLNKINLGNNLLKIFI